MREFIIVCVFIGITIIIGLVSFLVSALFDSESGTHSEDHYMLAWIISTVIASSSITASMVIMGLL